MNETVDQPTSVVKNGGIDLNGVQGHVFRVDPAKKSFELLKETAIDPRSHEGKSRHTLFWTDATRFVKVVRQNSFAGLKGESLAYVPRLNDENAENAAAGREVVVLDVVILADEEDGSTLKSDSHNLVGPFQPDPAADQFRGGTITVDGKPVPVRLRGPRARVDVRTVARAGDLARGFWGATVYGRRANGRFVVGRMDIHPRLDPREVDDPDLPRILVVGDSISMNYHGAAKKALEGVANYYRVDGNGGDTERGLVCMDLWLGDYTQPGLHWDLIQFNHGLHDLKQVYDEETGEYGAYQVPLEDYKANLEKAIQIMKKTGATLVWCSTTPVPEDYHGRWSDGTFGRRSEAVDIYNRAALEMLDKYPEIYVNDLNRFIAETEAFDAWRQQKDVHFWDGDLQKIVGQAVADRLKEILEDAGRLKK